MFYIEQRSNVLKIGPKFQHQVSRYLNKNTVSARYNKNMDAATVSGILTGVQVLRLGNWEPHDIGITAMLGTITMKSIRNAFKEFVALQPIKKRAIQIKNIRKNNPV